MLVSVERAQQLRKGLLCMFFVTSKTNFMYRNSTRRCLHSDVSI